MSLPLFGQQRIRFEDPLSHSFTVKTSGQDSVWFLPHRFLVAGSEDLILNDRPISKDRVRIETMKGRISIHPPPDSGSTVQIQYRALPVALDSTYSHWSLLSAEPGISDSLTGPVLQRSQTGSVTQEAYGDELKRSGSIFRGISLGTDQGMRLQSGLRLQVAGQIARDVEVVASLTDQNTPIQPEGNTQTLQEIDKVFIDVKAPHFTATLGDFVYSVDGSSLGTYERKLQGAKIRAESSAGAVTLMGAASKGEFITNHLNGREGNQGPYQLTGAEGQQDVIILAGTERIYIDGERLTRGEDFDYVIEYGLAQITFTRNRLVTGDSRITVDFEYSDQKFQKSLYGAQVEGSLWQDRIELRSTFLREADDKDNPVEFPLDENEIYALSQAGDHPDSAVVDGSRYVGTEKGNYVKRDSLGTLLFLYVGDNQGDYTVRFSHVGYGRGDYSFQGYGIYRYEGTGKGTYLPNVLLPPAKSHQMAHMSTRIQLGKGVALSGEAAFSDQDLNLFSGIDDGDNAGSAYDGKLTLRERALKIRGADLGQLSFESNVRHVGESFRPVGRMSAVEHGRKWGTSEGRVWGEDSREVKARYAPRRDWSFEGEVGAMQRGSDFSSDRRMFSAQLAEQNLPRVNYRAEWIHSDSPDRKDGSWLRQTGSIASKFWSFQPELLYDGEHRKETGSDSLVQGFLFDEWTGRLGFEKGPLGIRLDESVRDDRRYDVGILNPFSIARTERLHLDLSASSHFSSTLTYIHRTRDYSDPATEDQLSDLADGKIRFSSGKQFLETSLNYRFSSTQVSEMIRDTLQVGSGFGNYRLDEIQNQLIPDPDGDLMLRMIQTGNFVPVNDLKSGLDIKLDAGRLWSRPRGFRKFVSAIKGRSRIRIERQDKMRGFVSVNRSALNPRWGLDTTLVSATFSLWQDLEYAPRGGRLSIRVRLQKTDSENHQIASEGLVRHLNENSLRLKAGPTGSVGVMMEVSRRLDEKIYESLTRPGRDIRLNTANAEISVRPKQRIELALKVQLRDAEDHFTDPETHAFSYFLIPRFSYAFTGRGHLRTEIEWGNVVAEPESVSLPYEMLGGDQPGRTLRWNLLFTYRMTGHVQATVNWRGRQEPWRDRLYQSGQVEVRAFF